MAKTNVERIRNLLDSIQGRVGHLMGFGEQLGDWHQYPAFRESSIRLLSLKSDWLSRADRLSPGDLDTFRAEIDHILRLSNDRGLDRQIRDGDSFRKANLAIEQECISIKNMLAGIQIGLNQMSLDELGSLVPDQKIAAFQFGFDGDSIVVLAQPPSTSEPDASIAAASNEVLVEQGFRIAQDLKGSNCSPRLIQAFEALQGRLTKHKNIVEVGMLNVSCSKVALASADELSNTLLELIKAHIDGVYDYLAQHSEWRIFVENSLSTKLARSEVVDLVNTARSLATHFASDENSASAKVPQALESVATVADDLHRPDGRVTLALARTIENLISLVTRVAAGLRNDVVSEARKWIARSVLVLAATLALPTLAKVPGAEWIPDAVSYAVRVLSPK
ncbi:MAG: hypothetical protein CTR54_09035 [Rhizobium sp.]|nr:MAG: hypothetical protein CTR54_09035 [Rhizobium sp.]